MTKARCPIVDDVEIDRLSTVLLDMNVCYMIDVYQAEEDQHKIDRRQSFLRNHLLLHIEEDFLCNRRYISLSTKKKIISS